MGYPVGAFFIYVILLRFDLRVPSRYITFDAGEEDIDYDARMKELQMELKELMDQEQESKKALMEVLEGLGYGIS